MTIYSHILPKCRGERMYTTRFSWTKIIWITRIWRKSVFRVWQLSTLVPIKMSVSSLTELHTPGQTICFRTVSKEQPLFKSVTRLNPVFQPIFTVTIVTGWNTGFHHMFKKLLLGGRAIYRNCLIWRRQLCCNFRDVRSHFRVLQYKTTTKNAMNFWIMYFHPNCLHLLWSSNKFY